MLIVINGDDMNKKLLRYEIFGFIIISILGSILHFAYDWSNKSIIVALFCPINESPWEHLKLLFFPYIAYAIFEKIKLKDDFKNIFAYKYISILFGIWTTLSIFYTVNGAFGREIKWINILSYYIGIGIAFVISYLICSNYNKESNFEFSAIIMVIITSIIFILFTFVPPLIPLFQDPLNLSFGI